MLALYFGGMGAKGQNFYNDVLKRYGFEQEAEQIQDAYLGGDRKAGGRAGARRTRRRDVADRGRRLRAGPDRRLPGLRRHDSQRAAGRPERLQDIETIAGWVA